ncbi:MAG: hypothetical protein IJH75_02845 [Mogibacterium sp.]|nr:hypothetical protein [Mogibacterium sp.]
MKKRWLMMIAIYLLALLGCALLIYVVPSVAGLLEGTYLAEYGRIEVSDEDVTGWVVRDERVYTAVKGGEINRLAEEGKLVKAGSRVVELTGEGRGDAHNRYEDALELLGDKAEVTSGLTSRPGYVSYDLDGAETILSADRLADLTEKECKAVGNGSRTALPDDTCSADEPIFKIITNGDWYVVSYLENEAASKYTEGRTVQLVINGETVQATVRSLKEGKKKTRIVFSAGEYSASYLTERQLAMKVIMTSADGLILQKESLVEIDGQTGVIVKNKIGKYYFRPVRIKADNGSQVAVYEGLYMDENNEFVETISTYDEILREPSEKELEEITAEVLAEKEAEQKALEEQRKKEEAAAAEAAKKAEEAQKKAEEAQKAADQAKEEADTAAQEAADASGADAEKPADPEKPAAEDGQTEQEDPEKNGD